METGREEIIMNHPEQVTLVEVGPRDGFQREARFIPTSMKIAVIDGLAAAGLRHIQVTAFVNPRKVPQMADAEQVAAGIVKRDDVTYSALALNVRGVERAVASGLGCVEVSVSASDAHSRRNAGMGFPEALIHSREMIRAAKAGKLGVAASIQCAFGCVMEGLIPESRVRALMEAYLEEGADRVSLADTTGMATPPLVTDRTFRMRELAGAAPLGLHLHDTRGLGLVNLMAGLNVGVSWFDTALGGLGGCPFVPDAAGNIATEDTLYLLSALGIETGVNRNRVGECSERLEAFLGKRLPGKLYRLRGGPEESSGLFPPTVSESSVSVRSSDEPSSV